MGRKKDPRESETRCRDAARNTSTQSIYQKTEHTFSYTASPNARFVPCGSGHARNPQPTLSQATQTFCINSISRIAAHATQDPRRHARGKSKGSVESDSDDDSHAVLSSGDDRVGDADSADELVVSRHQHKRRRVGDAREADADEEAFWLGGGATGSDSAEQTQAPEVVGSSTTSTAAATAGTSTSKSSSQGAPLLYRRLQAQAAAATAAIAPVSPPPSHRKAVSQTLALPVHQEQEDHATTADSPSPARVFSLSASPPSTPRRQTRSQTLASTPPRRGGVAFRDSPDNPFLATPEKHVGGGDVSRSPSASVTVSSADPSPQTPGVEKPTMTYVFRGVRRVYNNPLYNHAENRPYSPPPASKLPIDHPDFSPAIHCTPKMLFPEARRGGHKHRRDNGALEMEKKRTRSSSRSPVRGERSRSPVRSRTSNLGKSWKHELLGGDSDEEEEEEDEAKDIKPQKLDFGAAVIGRAAAGRDED
ncbi:hypothetical protein CPB84DRAFT_1866835 [Gymnopilus junonius]|uniref:Uncharacterized protein n=1 Tax=Gymnopilus junonius TaxID=109634 RepID=A0A9P5NFJ4_GYMJU|nr:hypothetical protein CPB84DRAFT_1866835 [Gymnopilus junonius]